MHEVSNYAFYDNQFLEKVGFTQLLADAAYAVANPVSEHWTHLVSSLVPHLFKNIEQNVHEHDRMAFFEINTIWKKRNTKVSEQISLAGIWYQATEINFYDYKEKVTQIFKLLSVPVLWRKPQTEPAQWYHPHKTAELVVNDKVIGYAGSVRPDSMRAFTTGHAFIFEIELDVLLHAHSELVTFTPLSPYQPVTTDISLLVPFTVSVDALEHAIALTDARIYQVHLRDYFEKPEWTSQRALTLRYKAVDEEKTFSKQEIEQLRAAVLAAVQELGVTVR
jgi:phenylalanyl-tRNA synthetase beta chain